MESRLQELMDDIKEWSDGEWGKDRDGLSMLHHLKLEVTELITALTKFKAIMDVPDTSEIDERLPLKLIHNIIDEYADCFMLILDSASHQKYTADSLIDHTYRKLEINKQRKWGPIDKNGVSLHVKSKK